jgi:IclR family KDG regulon transcriptional repressor
VLVCRETSAEGSILATAIQKTFKCIEALASSPGGLTVSEVAAIAGFSRPAATRLLEGLTADSILIRDPKTKRYRLGLRLYQWANLAVQAGTPINIARKEFVKLSIDLQRECNLLVLEDLDVVILERCECVDGVPLNRPVSARRIWHQTATGKAIVAFLPQPQLRTVLERTAKRNGERLSVEDMAVELEEVRQRGYALSHDIRETGTIGVPVFGQTGQPVAAIGSFIEGSELELGCTAPIVTQMTATAARVSHYLGHQVPMASVLT